MAEIKSLFYYSKIKSNSYTDLNFFLFHSISLDQFGIFSEIFVHAQEDSEQYTKNIDSSDIFHLMYHKIYTS